MLPQHELSLSMHPTSLSRHGSEATWPAQTSDLFIEGQRCNSVTIVRVRFLEGSLHASAEVAAAGGAATDPRELSSPRSTVHGPRGGCSVCCFFRTPLAEVDKDMTSLDLFLGQLCSPGSLWMCITAEKTTLDLRRNFFDSSVFKCTLSLMSNVIHKFCFPFNIVPHYVQFPCESWCIIQLQTQFLRNSASSIHWLSSSIFTCSSSFVSHTNISSYLHNMF